MLNFVGLNGQVSVDEDKVILTRESKLDSIFHEKGVLTIPLNQIEKVVFSEGGLTNGYMAFLRKGDKRPHSVFSAMKNKNTVIFRMTKNSAAREITDYVKSMI